MLPSIIVTLDHFPLSTSGKIDRKAFPVPESFTEQSVEDSPESVSPSSAIETKLLSIFREILRSESIGVTDSFFRYGGYSLLTVRLFSRIERELGIRLPISLLFDAPTVRQLARVIEKGSSPSALVPIRPGGRLAPLFIIQSYLLYNVMLELVEADRPIYGLRETTDESAPLTIEERARRFAAEIRSVQPEGPIYLSGWCAAGTLTVEIARQLREAGHIVGLVVLFDAERPGFGPARGLKAWLSRARKKSIFHFQRIHAIPWKQRVTYSQYAVDAAQVWAFPFCCGFQQRLR
jgi:acyl carrier protein